MTPRVAVVDHGMGNLRSVVRALEAAGATAEVVTSPESTGAADALCVPGQGVFGHCMTALEQGGWGTSLPAWIDEGKPYLGICLGMQVLFASSEEAAEPRSTTPGMGILPGRVVRLPQGVTVPHIGWNRSAPADGGPGDDYYFDHSYAVVPEEGSFVEEWCEHGIRFAALVRRGPILATQFHPEKSGGAGINLLRTWVREL